jgi:hypothetical protein
MQKTVTLEQVLPLKKTVIKKTISLRPDVWEYVSIQAEGNASAFINEAISQYRNQQLQKSLIRGYQAMASDPELAEDLVHWDTTLLDGLDDEEHPSR